MCRYKQRILILRCGLETRGGGGNTLVQCDYKHISKRHIYMDIEKVSIAFLSYCTVEVDVEMKVDAADPPAQSDMNKLWHSCFETTVAHPNICKLRIRRVITTEHRPSMSSSLTLTFLSR